MVPMTRFPRSKLPSLCLYVCRQRLLTASGVPEGYTLRDHIKPDPSRVRRNLSGVVNFQKYREEKMNIYRDYEAKAVREGMGVTVKHSELVACRCAAHLAC